MYMRYLGGGVGHREEYLTVDHAREQSHRARRARLRWEHTNGARVVGKKMEHEVVDADDAVDDEQSDHGDTPAPEDSDPETSDEDEDAGGDTAMHSERERSRAPRAPEDEETSEDERGSRTRTLPERAAPR